MNNQEIDDEEEFERHYYKQSELSLMFSTAIVIILLILSFVLCRILSDDFLLGTFVPYEMTTTVLSIDRVDDSFSMTVKGMHEGQLEVHKVELTKHQYMQYKEGQEVIIKVDNNNCYIID